MLLSVSEPTLRLTRRSLLISSASAGALLAMPGRAILTLAAQTPAASTGVFFDPALVHDVAATFDQDEYDAMIDAYKENGDKEWLKASITIDGTTFDEVGLRLKGNSSLMALQGNNGGFGNGPMTDVQAANESATDGTPVAGQTGGMQPPDGGGMMMGGTGGNISADEPEGLPWLVRLDKYVDDQNYNGLSEFVIRSNNSETALNEALALDLLAEAGLASQAAAYIRFTANDSEPRLRIAIENPDDTWMAAHFSEDGTLFKSEAEGNWSFRDDNWESYVESFDLEAGGGDDDAENYAPLISFLDFVNNSDDPAFAADLPERLDTEQFAVYMAMMDLIQNGDAIDGPGNNSYLYYDPGTGIFTVVPWDMNLAFGGMMGGGGGFGGGQGMGRPPQGQFPTDGGTFTIDGTPVAEGDLPSFAIDGTPVAPGDMPARPGGGDQTGPGGGFGGMNNPLASRWDGNADFAAMQSDTQERLRGELFESGVADDILARWVAVLETHASDLVDQATIDSESQALQEQIDAA